MSGEGGSGAGTAKVCCAEAYFFRHLQIGQQLIAGVDVFLLAKDTGTNSDIIERFYGQVKLERTAKDLRPEWRIGAVD